MTNMPEQDKPNPIKYPSPLQALAITLLLLFMYFLAFMFSSVIFLSMEVNDAFIRASVFYLLGSLLIVPAILFFSSFPHQEWPVTLGFHKVSAKTLSIWLAIWFGVMLLVVLIQQFILDVPDEQFMEDLLTTNHPLLVVIMVLSAPLVEELYFRGFLFCSLRHTRLGFSGTLVITSVLFTAIHSHQYGFSGLMQIFTLAVLLGVAREKSGSLLVPIFLHLAQNSLPALALLLG